MGNAIMPLTSPDKYPTDFNYQAYHRDLNLVMEADWDAMYRMLDYIARHYSEHGDPSPTFEDAKIITAINFLTKILPGTIQDWQATVKGE